MIDPSQDTGPLSPCGLDEPPAGNYFVSTYPPFSTWTKDGIADVAGVLDKASVSAPDTPLGLYVHIPFCVERCQYCYYLSHAGKSRAEMDEYVDALLDELRLYRRTAALSERAFTFVYFGGGTPSLLPANTLARLMDQMRSIARWSEAEEISFECAPKTASESKLRILKDSGVSRLSLGVQTLDNDVLRRNGRVHLAEDVERAYAAIRTTGFPVVNIDLIVGLVGETATSFFDSLDRVIAMNPESVTLYQLEVPKNTPLYKAVRAEGDDIALIPWERKRQRLARAFERLEQAGYQVRSAYSAVRDAVKHRFVYQDAQYHGADLLGIGLASFSYLDGVHFQNATLQQTYLDRVRGGSTPIGRAYRLSSEERLIREFVLQMKLGRIDIAYFQDKFRVDVRSRFASQLSDLERLGWIETDSQSCTLTRDGLLRVDRLLAMFYRARHREVRYS